MGHAWSLRGRGAGVGETHVRAYEAHLKEVFADMGNFRVASERSWIQILHANSDAVNDPLSASGAGRG